MRLGCDMMLTDEQRTFVVAQRRAVLATLSTSGNPRMVPICLVLAARLTDASRVVIYSPLDEKPKQAADVRQLARVRDIAARPPSSVLFERRSEDWSELAWLRAHGHADLLEPDHEPLTHQAAARASCAGAYAK